MSETKKLGEVSNKKKPAAEKKPVEITPPIDPLTLRDHVQIKAIFTALEEKAKFKVDMSLMDEMVNAVCIAKELRAKAHEMRLPSRYKTEDDLHELAAFFREAQSKRDRVIEIKLDHMPLRKTLSRFLDAAMAILYQHDFITKMSPAPKRDVTMKHILKPLYDRIVDVDLIIESASEADRHIGNAHFTIKELKAIGMIFIEGTRNQRGV